MLTAAGFEAFQSATRLLYGRLGELLADPPSYEAEEVARLLTRMEHVLGDLPPPPPKRP